MKLKSVLVASGLFAFSSTPGFADQTEQTCPGDNPLTVNELWAESKARSTLIDNGGSQARIERGRTYGAFMDAFWETMEQKRQETPADTVGDLFLQIQKSFEHADDVEGSAVKSKNVTPTLLITGPYQINKSWWDEIELNRQESARSSLENNSMLSSFLSSENGLSIGIKFTRNDSGDYIVQPISYEDTFEGKSLSLDSPVSEFKTVPKQTHETYWDDANVTDGYACKL